MKCKFSSMITFLVCLKYAFSRVSGYPIGRDTPIDYFANTERSFQNKIWKDMRIIGRF